MELYYTNCVIIAAVLEIAIRVAKMQWGYLLSSLVVCTSYTLALWRLLEYETYMYAASTEHVH